MKRFFNILTRKYKDADSFIKAYQVLHNRVAESVIEYDAKCESEEITRYHYTDVSLTNGLKIISQELKETGYQIDNVISNWIEKDNDEEWIGKYAATLPKNTSLAFSKQMLLSDDVKVLSFPLFEKDDLDNYASELKSIYFNIVNQESKIKSLGAVVENLVSKNMNPEKFDKLIKINKASLVQYKLDFAQELSKTKIMTDKTLNFLSLPVTANWETIAVHAYIRKLVETEFLSHTICFRRYVENKPSIIAPYFDSLGLYYTEEKISEDENTQKDEGSKIAC